MIEITIVTETGQVFWNKKEVSDREIEKLKADIYAELIRTNSQIKNITVSCTGSLEEVFDFDEAVWEDNGINFANLHQSEKPVIIEVPYTTLAKTLRDSSISEDLVVPTLDNAAFQCTSEAKDIKSVLAEATSISALDTDSVLFRLADNSWKEITLLQLKEVLAEFTNRKREVWRQFAIWDQGDKTSLFVVTYETQTEGVM